MGNVGDQLLEIVVGLVSVDKVLKRSSVKDHRKPIGDRKDASQDHQNSVSSISESEQIGYFARLNRLIFRGVHHVLLTAQHLRPVRELYLLLNELLHALKNK